MVDEKFLIPDEDLEFARAKRDTIPRILLKDFIEGYSVVNKKVNVCWYDRSAMPIEGATVVKLVANVQVSDGNTVTRHIILVPNVYNPSDSKPTGISEGVYKMIESHQDLLAYAHKTASVNVYGIDEDGNTLIIELFDYNEYIKLNGSMANEPYICNDYNTNYYTNDILYTGKSALVARLTSNMADVLFGTTIAIQSKDHEVEGREVLEKIIGTVLDMKTFYQSDALRPSISTHSPSFLEAVDKLLGDKPNPKHNIVDPSDDVKQTAIHRSKYLDVVKVEDADEGINGELEDIGNEEMGRDSEISESFTDTPNEVVGFNFDTSEETHVDGRKPYLRYVEFISNLPDANEHTYRDLIHLGTFSDKDLKFLPYRFVAVDSNGTVHIYFLMSRGTSLKVEVKIAEPNRGVYEEPSFDFSRYVKVMMNELFLKTRIDVLTGKGKYDDFFSWVVEGGRNERIAYTIFDGGDLNGFMPFDLTSYITMCIRDLKSGMFGLITTLEDSDAPYFNLDKWFDHDTDKRSTIAIACDTKGIIDEVDLIEDSTLVKSYDVEPVNNKGNYKFNGVILNELTLKGMYIAKCFSDKASTKIKW